MESLEQIKGRIEAAVPGANVTVVPNASPANQPSLLLDKEHAFAAIRFLRDNPELRLDYCSSVTGIDWLDRVVKKTVKVKQVVDGVEKEIDQSEEEKLPGYLEAVYHLFSITHKHGPVVIRLRTRDRVADISLPSLTPLYRSAEFQEREIYDLYGIEFTNHPDLRRILMDERWVGHPLRKDYPLKGYQIFAEPEPIHKELLE